MNLEERYKIANGVHQVIAEFSRRLFSFRNGELKIEEFLEESDTLSERISLELRRGK